jgi:hypothetical protein
VISTQAARDEAPMSESVDYGLLIEHGEIVDPGFHLTLYTAPPEADPWKLVDSSAPIQRDLTNSE